jgi:hypothetical protein
MKRAVLLAAALLGLSLFTAWMVFATSYAAETLHYLASQPSPWRFLELLWALLLMAAGAVAFLLDLALVLALTGEPPCEPP